MALTAVNPGLLDSQAQYTGFKNRIINGAMMIDQRNAGASVTNVVATSTMAYTVDRWGYWAPGASKFTVQRSSSAPVGFVNSTLITSLAATSIAAGDYYCFGQKVEGTNVSDLAWGTANAKTVTISFWVQSSLTGTFGGWVSNSANNRSYPFQYTISAANTWEQKTVTVAGDTTGTWLTTTGEGLEVNFQLGVGSSYQSAPNTWFSGWGTATGTINPLATSGATFYITGVQLEKGSTATSFDYRPYGTELALCQRYCVTYGGTSVYERVGAGGSSYSTTGAGITVVVPVPMRTTPSVSYSNVSDWSIELPGVSGQVATVIVLDSASSTPLTMNVGVTHGSNGSMGGNKACVLRASNTTNAKMAFSAEL